MIEIKNLTKVFSQTKALDNVNLKVGRGEIFAFLGPNGAGKTTTVKIMSGIIMPTSGCCLVYGKDVVKDVLAVKKEIAYIPDEPFVYNKLSGYEFLRFIGDIYNIDVDFQKKEIPKLLEMFDLSKEGDELLESYSHGMRQKLLIAAVLLRKPRVILFDEPTVGLDPKSIKKFKNLLHELASKGTIIFMCTHILEMAEKLCTKAAIINSGRIIAEGSIDELKRKGSSGGGEKQSLEDAFLKITEG